MSRLHLNDDEIEERVESGYLRAQIGRDGVITITAYADGHGWKKLSRYGQARVLGGVASGKYVLKVFSRMGVYWVDRKM